MIFEKNQGTMFLRRDKMKVSMKTMAISVVASMAAGAVSYAVVSNMNSTKKVLKKKMGKTIKNVGEVVENITSMLG